MAAADAAVAPGDDGAPTSNELNSSGPCPARGEALLSGDLDLLLFFFFFSCLALFRLCCRLFFAAALEAALAFSASA